MTCAEASGGVDHDEVVGRVADADGFWLEVIGRQMLKTCWVMPGGSDNDAPDSNRRQVGLAPPGPFLVRYVYGRHGQQTIAKKCPDCRRCRVALFRCLEENAPAVGGFAFVKSVGFEVVQQRVKQIADLSGIGTEPPLEVQRRIVTQRCP